MAGAAGVGAGAEAEGRGACPGSWLKTQGVPSQPFPFRAAAQGPGREK